MTKTAIICKQLVIDHGIIRQRIQGVRMNRDGRTKENKEEYMNKIKEQRKKQENKMGK